MKLFIKLLMILMVIGFMFSVGAMGVWYFFGKDTEEVKIPNVIDAPFDSAFDELTGLGLRIIKKEKFDNSGKEGVVLSQSPPAGSMVKKNRNVTVTISKGPQWIRVPSVTHIELSIAKNTLRGAGERIYNQGGLDIGNIAWMYNSSLERNYIISQMPSAGTIVPKNTAVDLLVSLGPKPKKFFMPDFVGKHFDAIQKTYDDLKLKLRQVDQLKDGSVKPGTIIKQSPKPGILIEEGTPFNVIIAVDPYKNPDETDEWFVPFQYIIPEGGRELYRLQVEIEDQDGKRIFIDSLKRGGEEVFETVKARGTVNINIWIDGRLDKMLTLSK